MTAKSGEGNRRGAVKSHDDDRRGGAGSRQRSRPGYVRIIGGAWRGRRLGIPRGAVLRPTPDRVRETLFNWLASEIEGAVCLDLFAGTGSLGFEALSRGAAEAWLVERDAKLAQALAEHAAALGAGDRAHVRRDEASEFLRRSAERSPDRGSERSADRGSERSAGRGSEPSPGRSFEPRFDVVFLDPPFSDPLEPLLDALVVRLRHRALVYVERPAEAGLPGAGAGRLVKSGRAGGVVYGLLRFEATAA
jgi:16S rRNA (guanine966-N2)-methyltransferase